MGSQNKNPKACTVETNIAWCTYLTVMLFEIRMHGFCNVQNTKLIQANNTTLEVQLHCTEIVFISKYWKM